MVQKKFPARLHVLLAREAEVGVIIRRGPSKSVCTILWDRKRDAFKLGQWMKGRIYERRSDLSPDGEHFIYFAMNGRWDSKVKGSWTAISRVPYLKAVALYAKGDCWHGGGLFMTDRKFWMNEGYGHAKTLVNKKLEQVAGYPFKEGYGGECPGVYYHRLQRDGWVMQEAEEDGATIFLKELSKSWVLKKHAYAEIDKPPGKGCYWDAHELIHEPTGTRLAFPEWEWAEWDEESERLVWATNGQLWAAKLGKSALMGEKMLQDFNEMKFEAIVAPY